MSKEAIARSMRLMGYPENEIAQMNAKPTAATAIKRIERIIGTFDELSSQRKTAVNPRDLIEDIREAMP